MANTTTVLTNKAELTYTSDKVKAMASMDMIKYCGGHFKNFAGRIYVQATLVAEPTEADWFNIQLRSSADYYEYTTQTTGTLGSTFQGNFVWIRVKIDRSTLGAATYDSALHGLFDKAVLLI